LNPGCVPDGVAIARDLNMRLSTGNGGTAGFASDDIGPEPTDGAIGGPLGFRTPPPAFFVMITSR
jgi:hypothetical protein